MDQLENVWIQYELSMKRKENDEEEEEDQITGCFYFVCSLVAIQYEKYLKSIVLP